MDTTCAVCRLSDGLVMNIIVADPGSTPPDGCEIVEIMAAQQASVGWHYVAGAFHGPRRYAMCDNASGLVVAFFFASHVSPIPTPPDGYTGIPAETDCDIGWTWDGTAFHPPVA